MKETGQDGDQECSGNARYKTAPDKPSGLTRAGTRSAAHASLTLHKSAPRSQQPAWRATWGHLWLAGKREKCSFSDIGGGADFHSMELSSNRR